MPTKQTTNGERLARRSRNGKHVAAPPNGGPHVELSPSGDVRESSDRAAIAKRALDSGVPITEWDRLSPVSRGEVEQLVEVLKAVKQGDFSVRFAYHEGRHPRAARASCSTTSSA